MVFSTWWKVCHVSPVCGSRRFRWIEVRMNMFPVRGHGNEKVGGLLALNKSVYLDVFYIFVDRVLF